jgi:hypothetical protein
VRVPLDANLAADGPPSEPEPYSNADLAALPVGHIPRTVTVAPALTQAELDALATNTLPTSGTWLYRSGDETTEGDCRGLGDIPPVTREITFNGVFSIDVSVNIEFSNPEPGLFVADVDMQNVVIHYEIRVVSPTLLKGEYTADATICAWTVPFTLEALGDS